MSIITVLGSIKSLVGNGDTRLERQREIITRLKFIGTLQPGNKIDVNNLRIETSDIFTSLKRMIYGEGRDKTLSFFNHTYERVFEILQSHIHSDKVSEKILCSKIITDLVKSINGLKNIQETYKEDNSFVCNIESIIENIEGKLEELKSSYPSVFSEIDKLSQQFIPPSQSKENIIQ